MKNPRQVRGNSQPSSPHAQVAPVFRSPNTAPALAQLLDTQRAAVVHHGEAAAACRQNAEEHVRHIKSREQLIADKQTEIEQIQNEIARFNTAARNANDEAARHTQAQETAQLAIQDLEGVLGAYAPSALELTALANGTPPGGVAVPGPQAGETGGYPTHNAGAT